MEGKSQKKEPGGLQLLCSKGHRVTLEMEDSLSYMWVSMAGHSLHFVGKLGPLPRPAPLQWTYLLLRPPSLLLDQLLLDHGKGLPSHPFRHTFLCETSFSSCTD